MIDRDEINASVGIFLGIGLVAFLANSWDDKLLLAPFGATSVIAFLASDGEFAQPRNIVLGYILTSLVGTAILYFIGVNWYAYALAVSLAMIAKSLFHAVHPPSAAMPIILLHANANESVYEVLYYVFTEVLPGLLILVAVAIIYNRFILHKDYPFWCKYKR